MTEKVNIPVLNPNEPQYNYIKKIKEFNIKLKCTSYDFIFNTLKLYLKLDDKKYLSLYDIKNIKESCFSDIEYNKDFFTKNNKIIVDELKVKYDLKKFDKTEIIRIIRRMLRVIDYTLLLKKIYNTYYIRRKKIIQE